MSMILVF